MFLFVVIGIAFSTPKRLRWFILLLSSYYFYMCWKPEYVILILVSTLIDYLCAINIERSYNEKLRKKLLIVSIALNLLLLFYFKYCGFFIDNLEVVLREFDVFLVGGNLDMILPVGISFYTFQSIGYTISVYRRRINVERHLGYFAVYLVFFPQLIAGPIERAENLLPQLKESLLFKYENFLIGVKLILWGLFKKMVVADRAALIVNEGFSNYENYSGFGLLLTSCFFSIQIYCDFSAYSDIAIGSACIFGIHLKTNFDRPYFATSLRSFWRRWHISLTTWFKDYIYFSLGGNQKKVTRNVLIVFVISGLWHGANWTFIMWGLLHGLLLLGEKVFTKMPALRNFNDRTPNYLKAIFVFLTVSISWIPFRSDNIIEAVSIIERVLHIGAYEFNAANIFLNQSIFDFSLLLLFVVFLVVVYVCNSRQTSHVVIKSKRGFDVMFYSILILFIALFTPNSHEEFIYFQF